MPRRSKVPFDCSTQADTASGSCSDAGRAGSVGPLSFMASNFNRSDSGNLIRFSHAPAVGKINIGGFHAGSGLMQNQGKLFDGSEQGNCDSNSNGAA
jgi:hypothetical protein